MSLSLRFPDGAKNQTLVPGSFQTPTVKRLLISTRDGYRYSLSAAITKFVSPKFNFCCIIQFPKFAPKFFLDSLLSLYVAKSKSYVADLAVGLAETFNLALVAPENTVKELGADGRLFLL